MLEEGLNAEVIKCRSEEYGGELTVANLFKIKIEARSVKKLYLFAKLGVKSLSDERIKLIGIGEISVNTVDLFSSSVGISE